LFLLGLRWLPKRVEADDPHVALRRRLRRGRDLVLALAAGSGLATLSYAMLTRPAPQSIAPFYIQRALPEAGGSNIVNVMLVDFRSLDTLGEICVLGVVALTVYALLRRFRPLRESVEAPPQQRAIAAGAPSDLPSPDGTAGAGFGYLLVPATLTRALLPIACLVAVYLFLRGHNLPGGGFVAGVLAATALITQYMLVGTLWVEAHLALYPLRWIGVGFVVAVATGLGALALGYPFLTTHTAHLHLPLFGDVHLPSALAFDVGIFTVVFGSTLLILIALAHQSLRAARRPAEEPARRLAMAGSDAAHQPRPERMEAR
jgi:multicomponent K+:H+ antiporter subunit A